MHYFQTSVVSPTVMETTNYTESQTTIAGATRVLTALSPLVYFHQALPYNRQKSDFSQQILSEMTFIFITRSHWKRIGHIKQ